MFVTFLDKGKAFVGILGPPHFAPFVLSVLVMATVNCHSAAGGGRVVHSMQMRLSWSQRLCVGHSGHHLSSTSFSYPTLIREASGLQASCPQRWIRIRQGRNSARSPRQYKVRVGNRTGLFSPSRSWFSFRMDGIFSNSLYPSPVMGFLWLPVSSSSSASNPVITFFISFLTVLFISYYEKKITLRHSGIKQKQLLDCISRFLWDRNWGKAWLSGFCARSLVQLLSVGDWSWVSLRLEQRGQVEHLSLLWSHGLSGQASFSFTATG